MLDAERTLSETVNIYGKHQVSSDDGTWYPRLKVPEPTSSPSFHF